MLKNCSPKKVIISIVTVFVFLTGLVISLGSYYKNDQVIVAGESEVSDDVILVDTYKTDFKKVFNNYLLLTSDNEILSDDFLAKTVAVNKAILDMKVPAELKNIHLETIINLIDIETGIKSQDISMVLDGLYRLRDIINNL